MFTIQGPTIDFIYKVNAYNFLRDLRFDDVVYKANRTGESVFLQKF